MTRFRDRRPPTQTRYPTPEAAQGGGLVKYSDLSIDDAIDVRFARYRVDHGIPPDAPWRGDPLEDAFEEALDLVAYARECQQQGETMMRVVEEEARWMAEFIRDHIQARAFVAGLTAGRTEP